MTWFFNPGCNPSGVNFNKLLSLLQVLCGGKWSGNDDANPHHVHIFYGVQRRGGGSASGYIGAFVCSRGDINAHSLKVTTLPIMMWPSPFCVKVEGFSPECSGYIFLRYILCINYSFFPPTSSILLRVWNVQCKRSRSKCLTCLRSRSK